MVLVPYVAYIWPLLQHYLDLVPPRDPASPYNPLVPDFSTISWQPLHSSGWLFWAVAALPLQIYAAYLTGIGMAMAYSAIGSDH